LAIGVFAIGQAVGIVVYAVFAIDFLDDAFAKNFIAEGSGLGKALLHSRETGADVTAFTRVEHRVSASRAGASDRREIRHFFGEWTGARTANRARKALAVNITMALVFDGLVNLTDAIKETKADEFIRIIFPGLTLAIAAGSRKAERRLRAILQARIEVGAFARNRLAKTIATSLAFAQPEAQALGAVLGAVVEDVTFSGLSVANSISARNGFADVANPILVAIELAGVGNLRTIVVELGDSITIAVLGDGSGTAGLGSLAASACRPAQ
ncbi:MAG TPA: hypothetical protein VFW62_10000, partial [bacterium]|nr:hypothetical protein [bacterium]